jgi:hypothetical protein
MVEKNEIPPGNARNILYDLRRFGFMEPTGRKNLKQMSEEERQEHYRDLRRKKLQRKRDREKNTIDTMREL